MESSAKSVDDVVGEIMRIHRSLPTRPGIDEVEAARTLIRNVEKEDQARLEAIGRQPRNPDVPEELFMVFQEMQKNLVSLQSKEEKREALKLLDLEGLHLMFDDLIQRASRCLPSTSISHHSSSSSSSPSTLSKSSESAPASASATAFNSTVFKETPKVTDLFTRDDSYVKKTKSTFYVDGIGASPANLSTPQILDSSLKSPSTSGQDSEKLSLIKLASLIEVSSKKGTRDLNLQNKLMDQIEWLPDSIGKLSSLMTLDLSENRIVALPATIGGLSSLTKLDLHSNRIAELPDCIGNLLSVVVLDLRGNQLTSLPATFCRLTNDIEEIPHTIGQCSSLKELRADYNRLKALPEAVGRIQSLEILSVRYNNIKQLPTTMSSLSNLRELDVSFNELESIPESLCFATTLVKMNIGSNFADLQYLPRSIGNLEMLEELDISNNQIRVLPDSFKMLTRLRVLRLDQNPLEMPPRHVAEMGAQAVVQYMAELVAKREVKSLPVKQKKTWAQRCFFSRSNKRKRNGMDYVKA
ncbi:Plant intracellular Ras-group-related LRR protein 4 [Vitis vinifera]|uniref:Plant intracellular Ras-group-related LRR protein 4 n=1 Tax=Vitis vinifera TaxID=29760 RepID=A0A438F4V8_VITVI|nr:Plant intracellular Ras-group-related LRR protein 4 [Vitis vinifera]